MMLSIRKRIPLFPELLLSVACVLGILLLHATEARENRFWGDEIITVSLMPKGWTEIIVNRYWHAHSPLYFLLLKVWLLIVAGPFGLDEPNEFLVRLPSMLASGLAGGFFAASAWRAWGVPAGFCFVPLWVLNAQIGTYAIDARPYALLLLVLSIAVWSGTRLWIGYKKHSEKLGSGTCRVLWLLSAVSPAIAAAVIPVGIIAVISTEISTLGLCRGVSASFVRPWKFRAAVSLILLLLVSFIFAPGILEKSTDFWTNKDLPFSFGTVSWVLRTVTLQSEDLFPTIASLLLLLMGLAGLFLQWNNFLGRASAGLALVFPAFMIITSAATSLLLPRYFLPMIPGIILLAAGLTCKHLSRTRSLAVGLALGLISALFLVYIPHNEKSKVLDQQLELLQQLKVSQIHGVTTGRHLQGLLSYYIKKQMGFAPELEALIGRAKPIRLGQANELFWIFTNKKGDSDWVLGVPLTCHFALPDSDVYVVGGRSSDLSSCPLPQDSARPGGRQGRRA